MLITGIDVGSRTIKLVVLDSETARIVDSKQAPTTYHPLAQAARMLDGISGDGMYATGYGRKLIQDTFDCDSITEIGAHALGTRQVFPECRAVLDIGGQDTKAILVDGSGKVRKFEMNDRCAAGTGKFLEFMATSFQVPIEEFGDFALQGEPGLMLNTMCTVFAQSEATSLMARGYRPEDIARALHLSVVKRSLSMLKRISAREPVVFSGGVARNPCVVDLIKRETGWELLVPPEPEMMGALGAAIYGATLMEAGCEEIVAGS
ncbi:MAG TPA: acyl-CoA dehydratase activase [Desulfomonilaceae bacterium]|nr:acyl-CoA dehydratase activase [Desulfomonilaceae bacterium]